MCHYFIELRTRKYDNWYGFSLFARNFSKKYRKQLLDAGLDSLKTYSKTVVHKAGEFLGNKIADTDLRIKLWKLMRIQEIIIPTEEKRRNETSTIKMEHYINI